MNNLVKASLLVLLGLQSVAGTALDDYVWTPDANYKWEDMGPDYVFKSEVDFRGYTAYTLNMTSQRWLTDADFSAGSQSGSIWWHYLVVIVPDNLKYKQNATMWITGGNMGNGAPHAGDEDIVVTAALATNLGMISGVLYQIPNEHTTFSADPKQQSRTEDAIIAFTWDHFLNDASQPEWLLRFPMVKASLRAMDTITEFAKQKLPELGTSLDYYMVSGASKRGWTTWDVGAVDPKRVMAIVPVVLDAINFVTVEHHEYRSYGGWSYALTDYVEMNITERFDDPNMVHLQENVDPYWYVDRLTMPKFIVNAGMDEFQQPDDNWYWWDKMPEPKHVMMIPNAEHSLITGILEAVPSIGAWGKSLLEGKTPPQFKWTIDSTSGDIVATVEDHSKVHSATLWFAHSCGENAWDNNTKRRDYRIAHLDNPCTCGPYVAGYCINLKTFWQKKELTATTVKGKATYTAHMDMPTDGTWTAFFIDFKFQTHKKEEGINLDNVMKIITPKKKGLGERKTAHDLWLEELKAVFPDFGGFPHDFAGFFEATTQVSVIPNTFPYPDCSGVQCGDRILQIS